MNNTLPTNYKKIILIAPIIFIALVGLSSLLIKIITGQPLWKFTGEKPTSVSTGWQQYISKEYGFSFQYPSGMILDECWNNTCGLNVTFGSENFKEIAALRNKTGPTKRYSWGVLIKEEPLVGALRDYVEQQREIIRNVTLNSRQGSGLIPAIDFVVKEIEIDTTSGYVIETISSDSDIPRRRFFLPIRNQETVIILEIENSKYDILSHFKINYATQQ